MKRLITIVLALSFLPVAAYAYQGHQHNDSHKFHHSGGSSHTGGGTGGGTPTPPPVTPSPVPPPTPVPPATGELKYLAYTTGYAALDNTPAGATTIDLDGHHGNAGGSGTSADPITLAVGHSTASGEDVGDFPYGTKWYVPNLRKYFIAQDSCGDSNPPQNSECHLGFQGHVWIDLYVGASLANAVLGCEDAITDLHMVIQNPASNYAVVPGAVFDTGCHQFGDAVVTI